MPYLQLNNKQVYYSKNQGNSNRAIIFLHGSGGGHHHWGYQVQGLAGSLSPFAPDLPGHFRSTGEPLITIADLSKWVNQFADRLGLESFILGGHSLGGAIALDYALRYPGRLTGLALVGTGARLKVLPAFLDSLKRGALPEKMFECLYGPQTDPTLLGKAKAEYSLVNTDLFYADLKACDDFDLREDLSRINLPVLIVCGSEDLLTPPKYSFYLKEKIAGSRAIIFEGAGHMLMLEKPLQLTEEIKQFFL